MTPDERDRLVRLEVRLAQLTDQLGTFMTLLSENSKKLDELFGNLQMGRGMWIILIKLGAIVTALAAAAAWMYDHFLKR